MAAPPKEGLTFDPRGMREIARAYETVLRIAGDESNPLASIPAHELRQWLAGLILAAAREGPMNAERLTQAALRGLQVRVSSADLSAYCERWNQVADRSVTTRWPTPASTACP